MKYQRACQQQKEESSKIIYFRQVNKRSYRLPLNDKIDFNKIKEYLALQKNIKKEEIKFIYEGEEIKSIEELRQDKQRHIVHIIRTSCREHQTLTITINFQNKFKDKYSVESREKIQKILTQIKKNYGFSSISLIYLGKYLNQEKSFQQAFVSNHAQIFAIPSSKLSEKPDIQLKSVKIAEGSYSVPISDVFDVHKIQKNKEYCQSLKPFNNISEQKEKTTPLPTFKSLQKKSYLTTEVNLVNSDTMFFSEEELPETENFLKKALKEFKESIKQR